MTTSAAETFRLQVKMSKLGQVIYLTHHKYLCDIARSVCPSVHINDMQSVLVQVADMPALHSFQIVDDGDDLSNATAINSSLASGARLLGNTIIQLLVPEDRRARHELHHDLFRRGGLR